MNLTWFDTFFVLTRRFDDYCTLIDFTEKKIDVIRKLKLKVFIYIRVVVL